MAVQPVPEAIAERRREARGRQIRRRRAGAALAIVVIAGAAAALALGGGDSGPASKHGGATAGQATGSAESHLVRNAIPQPGWGPHRGPVPILMYHVLGQPIPGNPYPDLFVPRAEFRAEMDWLDRHGYEAVTLDEAEDAWYRHGTLPHRPIVISFDDGYRPQYTFALPELRRHGWPGLLNLKAVGSDLYSHEVRQMIAAGWELASHTINHLDLATLGATDLRHEVAGSRAILQQEYHVPVDNFCYPAGRYDSAAIAAVKAAGYRGATTTDPGFASSNQPYKLKRVRVNGGEGVGGLAAALAAG